MQIVIDISEKDYEVMKASVNKSGSDYRILKGTPLSKGHGRLIDADALKADAQTMTEWNGDVFRCVTERTIDYAPTIIEADRG